MTTMGMDFSGYTGGLVASAVKLKQPMVDALSRSGYETDGSNFAGYAHAEVDPLGASWEYARNLGLPHRTSVEQFVTLPDNVRNLHGFIKVDKRLFGCSHPNGATADPVYFVRFNDLEDLTNYTQSAAAPLTGNWQNMMMLCYARATKKIYSISQGSIVRMDPETMAVDLPTLGTPIVGEATNTAAQTIACDETYLYVANYTFNSGTTLYRFLLSNLAAPATTLFLPNNSQAHHLVLSPTKLFINGRETTKSGSKYYAWCARIDLATFTVEQTAQLLTGFISTKNAVVVGEYVYFGLETVGALVRVRTTDLTQQTIIATGTGNASFAALSYDGRYIWAGVNNATNNIIRVDPFSLRVDRYTVAPNGQSWVVDIISDGARLFIQYLPTTWPTSGGPMFFRVAHPVPTSSGWSGAASSPTLVSVGNMLGVGTWSPAAMLHTVGPVRHSGLATPGAPSLSSQNYSGGSVGNTTTYTYYIVAVDAFGNRSLVSNAGTITNAPDTLADTQYVVLTWTPVDGAVSYDVLKGDTAHKLASVQIPRFVDYGQATSGYTAPIRNETGDVVVEQRLLVNNPSGGRVLQIGGADPNNAAFGYVSIGSTSTGPFNAIMVDIQETITAMPNVTHGGVTINITGNCTLQPPSGSNALYGVQGTIKIQDAWTHLLLAGVSMQAQHSGSNTITTVQGGSFTASLLSSGGASNVRGVTAVGNAAGSGTVTGTVVGVFASATSSVTGPVVPIGYGVYSVVNSNLSVGFTTGYGVFVDVTTGTGPIGTLYGLYIKDQTRSGTTSYAIWVEANQSRFFDVLVAGKVGFYGTAPIAKPTVNGSKGANAALTSLMTALSSLGLVTDSTT